MKSFFKVFSILIGILNLVFASTYGPITIDGNLDDWKVYERLNLPNNLPPTLARGDALYGKYVKESNVYVFAFKCENTSISQNSTLWINADNDNSTGYKIWGSFLGAEFYVNIYSDGKPYLYDGVNYGNYVGEISDYAYSEDGKILEFAIPSSMIGSPESIGVMADINDNIFIPLDYSSGELKIEDISYPKRSDFSKRVAIIYSQTTKEHFYDSNLSIKKAYNQLFMAMQYQCMMAGIPFDLLDENDLTDISNIVNYDLLIFPYFAFVPSDKFDQIYKTLFDAVYRYGIGIITAGDFMTNLDDGSSVEGDSYRFMKQLFGIGRVNGDGPVSITLKAYDISHPSMRGYSQDEVIIDYPYNHWFNYFAPVSNGVESQSVNVLAKQSVSGDLAGIYDAVMAMKTGARLAHFSSIEFMADTNMLWSVIDWAVYGEGDFLKLHMGRFSNLFVSRVDMDQSQEIDEVRDVDGALYDILKKWKKDYNFVASCYINIGNNPPDQRTDWNYSEPLYRNYISLGEEIGTHSYTHPDDTNILSDDQIRFEFKDSMDIIASHLNPTWRDRNVRGGAVPGAPEGLDVAEKILQYLDYLTGGYSGVGAGYPGAFGFLKPEDSKVYLSPNMSFDFTLIEFGVPVWDEDSKEWIHVPLSKEEAKAYWEKEYKRITNHASLPIVHWPWHDYGPTTGVTVEKKYSLSMFTNTIELAKRDKGEFLTGADLNERIKAFKTSKFYVDKIEGGADIRVEGLNLGRFSIKSQKRIKSVDNWYAYNHKELFLDNDGGNFRVRFGKEDRVTHIYKLPMRSELISLNGDGSNLSFTFKGEGAVKVKLAKKFKKYRFQGADKIKKLKDRKVKLVFKTYGVHNVTILEK